MGKRLIDFNKKYNLGITIVRPTLIYGDIGSKSDKNFSKVSSLMKKTCILPIPSNSGIRQPIHISQLGDSILNISKSFTLNKSSIKSTEIINIGGDEELSYEEILNRIKKSYHSKDYIQNCNLIKLPNRIFS